MASFGENLNMQTLFTLYCNLSQHHLSNTLIQQLNKLQEIRTFTQHKGIFDMKKSMRMHVPLN
eukprot:m.52579 g.52579  ORF g.52579 m.52579 type:complete len:63 (-) comp11316_c0_seq2:1007-1195(-)